MLNRKCFICGHEMNEVITSINTGWGNYKLTIDGVRAYECPKCGEKQYDIQEMQMIQELSKSLSQINTSKQPDLLNLKEVADLLRVSNQTIYNMIKDGRLNPVKMGREWRFMRKDIESIISNTSQAAAKEFTGVFTKNDREVIEKHIKEM